MITVEIVCDGEVYSTKEYATYYEAIAFCCGFNVAAEMGRLDSIHAEIKGEE